MVDLLADQENVGGRETPHVEFGCEGIVSCDRVVVLREEFAVVNVAVDFVA